MTTPNDLPSVGTEDALDRPSIVAAAIAALANTPSRELAAALAEERFERRLNSSAITSLWKRIGALQDAARALVSERDELASRFRELENLRLEAVAEGFESIAEYVANLRTSASTYFAERNSARDVARKHRKTIESVEAALASKEQP